MESGNVISFYRHDKLGLCTSMDPAHRRRTPDSIFDMFLAEAWIVSHVTFTCTYRSSAQ